MRLFVLTYDRRRGELVSVRDLQPGEYEEANRLLAQAEFADPNLEVVLLEAESIDQLRRTHLRYFENLAAPITEAAS